MALLNVRKQKIRVTGSYILDEYDENLEAWLDSMGIDAKEFGPIFRNTKMKVMVQEPSKYNKKWSFAHKEEGDKNVDNMVTYAFESGKLISCGPDDDLQQIVCQASSNNVVDCNAEVKSKDWKVATKILFSSDGFTVITTNVDKNVTMSAKYTKAVDQWTKKKRKMFVLRML